MTTFEFTVTVGTSTPPRGPRCPIHGESCHIPAGWDPDHTDSRRPYTLDELVDREQDPHFHAYPTAEEYEQGWYLWRSLRRDSRLNANEEAIRWAGIKERIFEAMRADGLDTASLEAQF